METQTYNGELERTQVVSLRLLLNSMSGTFTSLDLMALRDCTKRTANNHLNGLKKLGYVELINHTFKEGCVYELTEKARNWSRTYQNVAPLSPTLASYLKVAQTSFKTAFFTNEEFAAQAYVGYSAAAKLTKALWKEGYLERQKEKGIAQQCRYRLTDKAIEILNQEVS